MSDAATAGAPIRVVIADDQTLVRTGFRLILNEAGITVAAEAANGKEAVAAVLQHRPDVVRMPDHHPHHVRPRPVRLHRPDRRGERVPAQGHLTRTARRGGTDGPFRRRAARAVHHPPPDRTLRPAPARPVHLPRRPVRPDSAGTPGTAADGPRAEQRRTGHRADGQHGDGQDPCGKHPRQAAATGPGPGHRPRLPDRASRPTARQSGPRRTVNPRTAPSPRAAIGAAAPAPTGACVVVALSRCLPQRQGRTADRNRRSSAITGLGASKGFLIQQTLLAGMRPEPLFADGPDDPALSGECLP